MVLSIDLRQRFLDTPSGTISEGGMATSKENVSKYFIYSSGVTCEKQAHKLINENQTYRQYIHKKKYYRVNHSTKKYKNSGLFYMLLLKYNLII